MSTPRKTTPRKQPMSPRRRSLRGTPAMAMNKSPVKTPMKAIEGKEKANEGKEEGIIVAVRMRPLNQNEGSHQRVWKVLPKYHSVSQTTRTGQPLPERVSGRTFFTFDKTFNETVSTTEVYDSVAKDIVSSVVSGLNGTIFAYGQTSSGKTYTMQGSGSIKEGAIGAGGGIVHMAANDIFNNISKAQDRIFLVRASFLEIYNEEVRDLLSNNSPTLQIREDPRRGVFVQSKEETVTDFDGLLGLLFQGDHNRAFASTAMNERSSRSHTIFRITIESRKKGAAINHEEDTDDESVKENVVPTDDGAVLISTLNLVDLAGSESVRHTGATGDRQKEGGMINTSLLTLSRVIVALGAPNQTHINFRDSKLTRILQPSLSGNARMAVICCATPSELYLEETRSTLLFASRAKLVKTRAQVNEVLDDRSIIKRLQRELAEARKQVPGSSQNNKQLKALELKADAAGNAAREAENKLVRLKNSILNYGDLFGNVQVQPTTVVAKLAKSFDGDNQKAKEKKGKRRYSEGAVDLGRQVSTPTRVIKATSPQTSHKISKLEPTSSSELQLLRDALAAKNSLIKDLSGELAKSKEEVATSNSDRAEAHIQIQQMAQQSAEKETELDQTRMELERSKATCTALSESYEELVEEKESMQQKLETEKLNLDGALQTLRGEHETLESQHSQAQRDLEELGRVHDDTKATLAVTEEENKKLLTTLTENEAEKASLLSELERSRREATLALDRISQLESQLCECKAENDVLSYQSKEQTYEYQELVKEKQKLEASFNQELASSMESNESLRRNNSELKATLDATEGEVRDLSKQVEQMSSDLVLCSKQVSDLESLLAKQTSEHDVSLKAADSIKEELVSAQEAISTLKSSLEEKKSDLTILARSLEDVMVQAAQGQSETFAMKSSNDKAMQQSEDLLSLATEIKTQQTVCNKETSEALAAIHALEQQIENIDNFVQRSELQVTTVLKAVETEKEKLQESLAASNDEKAVLSSSLQQSETALSSLRDQSLVYEAETKCQLATLEEKVIQVTFEKNCLTSELSTLKEECETQKTMQQDSEAQLAELTSECESARIASTILSTSLQEAESRIVTLEEDLQKESLRREEGASDLASATAQLEEACAALKDSELASAAFRAKHESLETQLGDLMATKALLEGERSNALSEIGKLDGKISDLELSVENSERCLNEAIETTTVLQQEKEQLEVEANASHDDLTSKLRAVESQVTVLQEKLDQEVSMKDQVATQLQDALADKGILESELESTITELEGMGARNSELEEATRVAKDKLALANEELEETRNSKQELEQSLAEKSAKILTLEQDIALAQQIQADLGSKVSAADQELSAVRNSREETLQAVSNLEEKLQSYDTTIDDLSKSKELLESQAQNSISEMEVLASRIGELQDALDKSCEALESQTKTTEAIQSEKESLEEKLQALNSTYTEVSSDRDTLASELEAEKERAGRLENELLQSKTACENEVSLQNQLKQELTRVEEARDGEVRSHDALRQTHSSTLESLQQAETEKAALASKLEEVSSNLEIMAATVKDLEASGEASANNMTSTMEQLQHAQSEKNRAVALSESLREENARLGKVIFDCNSRIEDMSATIAELTTSVEEGKSALATITKNLETVETERANAMQTLEQITGEKTSLQNDLKLGASKMEELASTIAKLTTDIEDGELKTTEIKSELESTQANMATLQRDLQLSELRNIESVEESTKQAEINIQGLHEELAKQKATNNELLAQLETEKKELKEACRTRDEALAAIEALQQKHTRLEADVDELSCNKVALEAANGSAAAEIELLSSRIRELQLELETSEKSLTDKVGAFATLKDEKDGLEAELRASQLELSTAVSSRDALEKKSHEVELRLMQLQEEMQSSSDDEEKLGEMRNELVALQLERDEVAAKYESLDQQHQTTLNELKTTFAEEKNELESRLSHTANDLSNAIAMRDDYKLSMKKTESQILSLEAKIEELEAAKDDQTNELLQQARSAAIAADDELADKERELQSALRKLAHCEEELQVLLEDSNSSPRNSNSNLTSNDFLEKYDQLEADYANAKEQLRNERADREASEKALKQMMGEEQRVLVQEGETRMAQLRTELEELRKRVTEAEAEAYAAREANEQCRDELKLSKTESAELQKELASNQEIIRQGKKKLIELERKVAEAEASYQGVVRDGKKKLMELERKLTESEAASSAATTAQSQYQEHRDRLEKDLSRSENENGELRTENQELQKKLHEQEVLSNNEISRLSTTINTNKAELYASRQAIQDLQDRLDAVAAVAEGEEATRALEEKLQETEKQLASKDAQIKKLEKDTLNRQQKKRLATMKDEHTQYQKDIKKLEKKLKEAQTENLSLQAALSGQSEESAAIEIQKLHRDYQKKLKQYEEQMEANKSSASDGDDGSQEKLHEEIKKIHADYTAKLKTAAKKITSLQAQLSAGGTTHSTETPPNSSSEMQRLRLDNEALQGKLKKYARHSQCLEDDKETVMAALSSTLGSALDNDLVDAAGKLCDQHLSLQEQCKKLKKQLEGQQAFEYDKEKVQRTLSKVLNRKVSSQNEIATAVNSLCQQHAALQEQMEATKARLESLESSSLRDEDLAKEVYQQKQELEALQEKWQGLQQENLKLYTDIKAYKQQLKTLRGENNQLRMMSGNDSHANGGLSGTTYNANILQVNETISNRPPSTKKTTENSGTTKQPSRSASSNSSFIKRPSTVSSFDSSDNAAMAVPHTVSQSLGSPSSSKALSSVYSQDSSESPTRKRTMDVTEEGKTPNGKTPNKRSRKSSMLINSARKLIPGSNRKKKKEPEAPGLGESGLADSENGPDCKQS